ncbi:PIG-L deacetylase family protein [Catalinimonas niigatensis]|uniref:PIG-L deacetylase family protein n=1 Tax=Catalinimonas niigatensis TaxID=1397264 RepID=UPI002665551A|nr:PIG-L deacetylase family protein [Catalinimonas niigatensis]WPP51307.1 PIG-L deacetylase family protein [Catalinimonas niigatensis]
MQHSLENITICPSSEVYKWATTLVVATHPDDEVMGCGGAIALLREMGYRVHVLFMCDGSLSYNEEHYLPSRYQIDLRRYEAETAMSILGVSHESITFLDVKDSMLPCRDQDGFEEVVRLCRNKIADFIPDTVLVPWRYDEHKDHKAVWQIMQQALLQEPYGYNLIEYTLKPWIREEQLKHLAFSDLSPWRLDNKPVLEHKIEAVSKYHSHLIDFLQDEAQKDVMISSEVLSYITHPWEIYLQATDYPKEFPQ